MKASAESIKRRLEAQEIRGIQIAPVIEKRSLLGIMPVNLQIGVEVRVPFTSETHDNRTVDAALAHKKLTPEQKLEQVIAMHLADNAAAYKAKGIRPDIHKWIENDQHVGYKAILLRKT